MRRSVLTALALCGVTALGACSTQPAAPAPSEPGATTTTDSAASAETSDRLVAQTALRDPDGQARGTVEFHETEGGIRVVATGTGLEPGFKGFHLHKTGKCEADSPDPTNAAKTGDFLSAGGHLGEGKHPEHVGDLPALLVRQDGSAELTVVTDRVRAETLLDNDGTAVVVHGGTDNYANIPDRYAAGGADEETTKAGDAGDRVACGVVEAA